MPDAAAASPAGLLLDRGVRSRRAVRSRALAMLAMYAVLTVMACIILVPLLATLLGGFKTLGELRSNPVGLPKQGNGETISAFWRARATGGCSAIPC
jgi:ABC-type glycerol-3-phosphate transport system permease component